MEIAKVDLHGVVHGGAGWEAARAAVTASMVAYGCVVVAHDMLGADIDQALFSRVLPELFALPLEVLQRTVSAKKDFSRGYHGRQPGAKHWDSIRLVESTDAASVRGFAEILWPEGNSEFCETIVSFSKDMMKLEEMVETLVLEGLGARVESIGAHFGLLDHDTNLAHYGAPPDPESSMSMRAHYDPSMVTAIVQHEVEGLEVHVGDGRWVAIQAETGTVTFIAGEQLRVVTNGRVPACFHRVRTPSNRERFSAQFRRQQKDGVAVHVLEDLVDVEHPLVFNPLCHEEYIKWRYTEQGFKISDALKAYCGVDKDNVVEAMA